MFPTLRRPSRPAPSTVSAGVAATSASRMRAVRQPSPGNRRAPGTGRGTQTPGARGRASGEAQGNPLTPRTKPGGEA